MQLDKLLITEDARIINLQSWLENLYEFQLDSYFEMNILARSYDYIKSINLTNKEVNHISATINGTSTYKISLEFRNEAVWGLCSCPHNEACKHLAALILSLIEFES